MTPERLKEFCDDINWLVTKYEKEIPNCDTWLETILHGLVEVIELEKSNQNNELVISCLNSVINGLQHAGFDYYCSTK